MDIFDHREIQLQMPFAIRMCWHWTIVGMLVVAIGMIHRQNCIIYVYSLCVCVCVFVYSVIYELDLMWMV